MPGAFPRTFFNKIGYVVEESDESVYWLEMIGAAGLCRGSELPRLLDEAEQLSRIFDQSQITAKANDPRRNRREYRKDIGR